MANANVTKDHTVRYIVSVLVNTLGRMSTEFYSVLEEVVSVVITVLQMVRQSAELPRTEVLATTKLDVNSDAHDLKGSTNSDFYRDVCLNYITLRQNAILFSSL
jgi:hypothetical protein